MASWPSPGKQMLLWWYYRNNKDLMGVKAICRADCAQMDQMELWSVRRSVPVLRGRYMTTARDTKETTAPFRLQNVFLILHASFSIYIFIASSKSVSQCFCFPVIEFHQLSSHSRGSGWKPMKKVPFGISHNERKYRTAITSSLDERYSVFFHDFMWIRLHIFWHYHLTESRPFSSLKLGHI